MPELAEVERAKNDCKLATEGKIIQEILTKEDKNVFQGCTHTEFADALRGKRVANVGRLGKYFYLVMQSAPHVVMHLGMAGFVSTKGQEPLFYRKKAKNKTNEEGTEWPLRYWKFALKMQDGTEWCFCDSRRFGRISLVHAGDKSILDVEPLSLLGRDPYLDMPSLDEFSALVLKRKAPIKAVLLDQNGPLCGLGNWLVDEILFQAAIHPAQKGSTLSVSQLLELHKQITNVVNTAVAVNADHAQFPKNWLFKYRWGKGRRNEPATFTLPDGTLATVIHQTVGGRTSAIVESVQKLLGEVASDTEDGVKEESEGEQEEEVKKKAAPKRSRKVKAVEAVVDGEQPIAPSKRRGRKAAKKEETEPEEMTDLKEEEVEDEKVVKITARKRKASPTAATSKRKQKIEVKLEPASEPLSARASRASARQARSQDSSV